MSIYSNVNVHRIEVSFSKSIYYSNSRGKNIEIKNPLYFEFFEIDNEKNLCPLDLETSVSHRAISEFIFLLTLDFAQLEDYPSFQESLNAVVTNTVIRIQEKKETTPFKLEWDNSPIEDLFIFFGGGVDSSAVSYIFPNSRKVTLDLELHDSYALGVGDIFIKTNLKVNAFNPKGFVFWSQPFAVAPILKDYYRSKNATFLLGSILGSSYLQNGKAYFNRLGRQNTYFGVTGNLYHSVFNELGIKLYAPLANCSEYISTYIDILSSEDLGMSAFCQNDNGHPCFKCFKCFRKLVERVVICEQLGDFSALATSLDSLKKTSKHIPISKDQFSYFYHIWQYGYSQSSSVAKVLTSLGFQPNMDGFEDKSLDLLRVYSEFDHFYQDLEFSRLKKTVLSSMGVSEASFEDTNTLKAYSYTDT